MKAILLEEAIRLMALIGLVIFGALPAAYALGADVPKAALVTLPLPFLIFPIVVWARLRTGRKFQASTRRGWLIMTLVGYAVSVALGTLLAVSGHVTMPRLMVRIAAGGLMAGLFAWLGPRMMRL